MITKNLRAWNLKKPLVGMLWFKSYLALKISNQFNFCFRLSQMMVIGSQTKENQNLTALKIIKPKKNLTHTKYMVFIPPKEKCNIYLHYILHLRSHCA